ncbi:hypothetical protein NMY22_g11024 [Coprinellus aureogranulatus]|nr:hypothetical protein NMY22_g11024 [Coprinellus aureogranulatus]
MIDVEARTAEFLSNAHHNHFEQVNITVSQGATPQSDITALLNPILDASHSRNRKISPPNSDCFPGTRTGVLQDINSWATGSLSDHPQHILWVFGYAGCGKSAIAQAIATQLAETRRLGGSFFFFRGSGDRSNMSRFAATLASQIANRVDGAARHIKAALKANPGLLTMMSTVEQLKLLVYDPIRAVTARWYRPFGIWSPIVIVIDGLDECDEKDEASAFVKQLIHLFAQKTDTPLRFLITSRVEDHLHRRLHNSRQVRLLNLVDKTSDEDIGAALDAAIADAKGSRVLATCEDTWLSPGDKQELIKHIGGSFIFMTTITKFLFSPPSVDGLTPIERLPLALNMNPGFDGLYTGILQGSSHFPHFSEIVSTVALAQEPLSVAQMAGLLNIDTTKVINVLVSLHAIFQVPGDDHTPITLWHSSLRDFLCSEDRSGPLFAAPTQHRLLAYRCISLTALSGNSPLSPSSDYSRRFAVHHWCKFLDGTPNGSHSLRNEWDSVVTHLQATFSADFRNTAPKYFHLDHHSLDELPEEYRLRIVQDLCGKSSPQVVLDEQHPWPLIKGLFDEISVKLKDDIMLPHLCQFHHYLLDASHHTELTKLGIRFLVRPASPSGTLSLNASLDGTTEYFFVSWAKHLSIAVQTNPSNPIFDVNNPTLIQIDDHGRKVKHRSTWYKCSEKRIEIGASNSKLALEIITSMKSVEVQYFPWLPSSD